jgi:hypothetical protein
MKGDSGDGVPNFLSNDDCLVAGIRQSPMTSKKMTAYLQELETKTPEDVFSTQLYRNWLRNRKLIDLDCIPDEVYQAVIASYESQSNKGRSKLFDYFIKNKLKNLTEYIGEF